MQKVYCDGTNSLVVRAHLICRARIDAGLVVDGQVIDLNRVELPEGVRVVDRRFGEE